MEKWKNRNKGITLIALVITIIVLLILAGVTIATLTGDNGLLQKATNAKQANEEATALEKIKVEVMGAYDLTGKLIARQIKENISKNIADANVEYVNVDSFPVKITYNGHKYAVTETGKVIENFIDAGEKAPEDSNAVYSSGNYIAVIPAGFTVSKTENSIENVLVVTDGSNNEWVWIPVSASDLTLMHTQDTNGWKMLGTTEPNEVITKYKTLDATLGGRTLNRINPGTIADPYYREPDVLSTYDTDQTYRTQAGFGDLADMATKLKDDYKDMIDSVRKNGGFYIGRYELGKDTSDNNRPQVKAGTVMNTNWYYSYKACKSFSSVNVESRMIWGCQWDQVCRFIKGNGADSIIDDSKSYGNYSNSTISTDISGSSNYNKTTGRSENWKIKNIYDIAGNCNEWTQEAYNTDKRARRGR